MSITLSSILVYTLSSEFKSETLTFVNDERNVKYDETTDFTSSFDFSYPEFSKNIIDLNFKDNYFTFLTNTSFLDDYINTLKNFGSNYYGSSMRTFMTQYDDIKNNFSQSLTAYNQTQFLGIVDNNLNFNLIPLKTKLSINDELYSTTENYRTYQKIYDLNDSIYLQFKIDKVPVKIDPDQYSVIFNSYNVASCSINDSKFIENGAIGGNCPLNSDVIFFDQNEYNKHTNNGLENINSIHNGTLLCLWLSSQTPTASSDKIWMERWYDPNTISSNNAYISQKNNLSASFSYIVDIPSTKILSEKEKFTYLRYGPDRNNTFIQSLSSNLQFNFKDWSKNFTSQTNNISGFIIGDYPESTDTLKLDGSIHAHIPPENVMFIENDFSVSLWANCNDWKKNSDSQFFGDYQNENGYGLFYNTGTPNNLLSIPTVSDSLFSLNNRGYKVFEKDLKNDLGLSAIEITYIKTDLFGNRWIYDNLNKNIYKLENDDLITQSINLPDSTIITKIECNSNNEVFIMDSVNYAISSFDSSGSYLSAIQLNSYYDNFDINTNDELFYDSAEFLTVNSENKIIKVLGSTLWIDNEKVLYLTDKPQCLRIDLQDNIWILLKNRIIKTDSLGRIIFDKILALDFSDLDSEMCFVKIDKQDSEQLQLWIIFNKQKYAVVLNENGTIVKRLDLTKLFVGNSCATFDLNVVGDFSGFDNKRKFETVNNTAISINNPTFTLRLGLSCGSNKKLVQLHVPIEYERDWTHISFTFKNEHNSTIIKFYINGILKETKILNKHYKVNYEYKVSPFIIGGYSGKLGAKNLEKSILRSGFFVGEIDDIKVYNTVLNNFEIKHLSLENHYNKWSPLTLYIDSPEVTMLEEIDTFHINRYKGFKSNYFNVKIKNFTTNSDLQLLIANYINDNISNFIPANTMLNEIVFE